MILQKLSLRHLRDRWEWCRASLWCLITKQVKGGDLKETAWWGCRNNDSCTEGCGTMWQALVVAIYSIRRGAMKGKVYVWNMYKCFWTKQQPHWKAQHWFHILVWGAIEFSCVTLVVYWKSTRTGWFSVPATCTETKRSWGRPGERRYVTVLVQRERVRCTGRDLPFARTSGKRRKDCSSAVRRYCRHVISANTRG